MSEREYRSTREPEPEQSVGDLIESAVRKIVTSIVIAGALVALGLYSQPGPARYQVTAADGRVFRIDTKKGTVIGCQDGRCAIVLRRGQDLEDSLGPPPAPVPVPAPDAGQIAPSPQAAPAPAPTGSPAQAPAPR